jgi:hypothetical protein
MMLHSLFSTTLVESKHREHGVSDAGLGDDFNNNVVHGVQIGASLVTRISFRSCKFRSGRKTELPDANTVENSGGLVSVIASVVLTVAINLLLHACSA